MTTKKYAVLATEVDGIELGLEVEVDLDASNVTIEDSELIADNVKDAVIEVLNKPKFIPRVIQNDLLIPQGKIAVLHEPEFEGNLILDGDVLFI